MPQTVSGTMRHRGAYQTLPAVMMRSGTSKGLFLHRDDMPVHEDDWGPILLSVMGSKEGDRRQIDGVGGATSTTSKVAVVSKSTRADADVDYTFVQVAVGVEKVDFSGNCGNMASGVGPFALDEGLVRAMPGQSEIDVRIYNTNTNRLLVETVQVDSEGGFYALGDCKIGGVQGTGSEIKVKFVEPAGSMTDKLFPTGRRTNTLEISHIPELGHLSVFATLIDAANPFVFVDSTTLPLSYHTNGPSASSSLALIESLRCVGSVKMGLARDLLSASLVRGTPKIAVLSTPLPNMNEIQPAIYVTSFSMGKVHPTLQLTGAVCLGSALCINGTVAYELSAKHSLRTPVGTPPSDSESDLVVQEEGERVVRIRHQGGDIDATVDLKCKRDEVIVKAVSVSRTARRLFQGEILYI